jgi:predicted nucleic acid-binding protein
VTVFLDTAVFMYAAGAAHELRGPCQAVLRGAVDRRIDAVTSSEVVQEVLHRYLSIRQATVGVGVARDILIAFAPVLPVTHEVMTRIPDLAERYGDRLSARDLVHVASCLEAGIDQIVTTDLAFDRIPDVRRVDPRELAA